MRMDPAPRMLVLANLGTPAAPTAQAVSASYRSAPLAAYGWKTSTPA